MIIRMSSVYVDGTWTDSAIYPPGEIQEPMHLFQPDQPMPACRCKPLKLEYNPNNEQGNTDFHCETPLNWEVSIVQHQAAALCAVWTLWTLNKHFAHFFITVFRVTLQ